MSVVVSVQDVGPCRKQLTVEVPAPAVEAETERVVSEYGRRVRIPGFRQGKVPRHLILRRFQKDIEHEVVERLLPRYWKQAEAESSLDPLLPPEVERVDDLVPGSPLTFVASVETRPQIELRNVRDFDLPDPPVDPGEMDIEDALTELRRQFSKWVPVELAAGQETTFSRNETGPHDAEHSAEPSGESRERRFRVRVKEVKERELPALDDELAQRVGADWKTADELRQAIVARLRSNKARERREQRETAVLDQLRDRHPMELPQGVLRQE